MSEPRLSAEIFVDPEDFDRVTIGLLGDDTDITTDITVHFGTRATVFWGGDFDSLIARLQAAYAERLAELNREQAAQAADSTAALPGEGGSYGGTE